MVFNFIIPAFAVIPPAGYTQVNDAGGTGSTNVSIQIEGSGNGSGGGGGEDPDNPGGGEDPGKPSDSLYSYLIQYHYDDSVEREPGQGKLYELIPYDMTTPKAYAGHNWLLEKFSVSKFIVADESNNTAELWYTVDDKDKDGNNVPGGDGVPDKYQDPENPTEPAKSFKYSVAYNYEDEAFGQVIDGMGTVGSVIPYSSPNTTTFNNKLFQLSKVTAKSNIITPEESQNKVSVDYNTLKEADKDNIPSDDSSKLYVTFDPANSEKITTQQVKHGTAIAAPENPSKAGYKFLYWGITDGSSYKEYNFNAPVISNMALVAQYELEAGTIAYKVQHYQEQAGTEGEFPGYKMVAEETLLGPVNTEVTATAKTYAGYKEDTANANCAVSGTLMAGSDLVLRLFYAKDMVTVTIDPDNGTGVVSSEIPNGTMISIPSEPSKPGFEFDGWTVNGSPANFDKPITNDITIKASWHKIPAAAVYKVEHYWENLEDNKFSLHETDTIDSLENTSVRAAAKPYTGFTEDKTNPDRSESGIVRADGSLTLKIFYTRNIYTVTIDPGNGGKPTEEQVKYGGSLNKPADPPYDGHTINGWKDKDTGAAIKFPAEVTDNLTITPIWTVNGGGEVKQHNYKITYHYDDQTQIVDGTLPEGSALPYATPTTKVFGDKNYVFVSKQIKSETISNVADNNQADIYYELDEAGNHGTVNSGDGIPDKYQIVVNFKAEHGSLSHSLAVVTKLDDNGNKAVNGTAKLAAGDIPAATASYGYRNGVWDKTPTAGLVVTDGSTFTIVFSRIPSGGGGSHGGGGGSGPSRPDNGNTNPANPGGNEPLADVLLDKNNHKAYIHGYPSGNVGPGNNITRGEVAQVIYALMKDKARDYYYTEQNKFTDVDKSLWCNPAISTIAKAGIIKGFPNGEFGYDRAITRAEFATIVSKFTNVKDSDKNNFNDVDGHWAKDYILRVAAAGWVKGYPDGGFHPNATLTRAEAVTIMNKILDRGTDVDHMLKDMKVWPDNQPGTWYYEAIQEASNGHNFKVTKGTEIWTELVKK